MKKSRLLPLVKEILFREWDPIGVNDNEKCRDEYDNYATSVIQLLLAGDDEHKLTMRLSHYQRINMGMSVVDEERDRAVAKRLLALVANDSKRSGR
jgi:hypothetical protein